jgi:hypothetical protein
LLEIGVVKRVAGTYRYYLTKAGRAATTAAARLTAATIIPALICGSTQNVPRVGR